MKDVMQKIRKAINNAARAVAGLAKSLFAAISAPLRANKARGGKPAGDKPEPGANDVGPLAVKVPRVSVTLGDAPKQGTQNDGLAADTQASGGKKSGGRTKTVLLRTRTVKGGAKPPIPSGRRALLIVADVVLLCGVLASSAYFAFVATREDERINVTLECDGITTDFYIFPTTVDAFLGKCGVTLGENEYAVPEGGTTLSDGDTVSVTRAYPVAVASEGQVSILHMTTGTVGQALKEANVDYTIEDELSHLSFEDLYAGMQITHDDVEIKYSTRYKDLDYSETTIKDSSMYVGNSKVEQEGVNGEKQITQRIIIKNGVETSREVVDQVVITPAVEEIIRIGTKIRYQSSWSGEFREYKKPPTEGENGWTVMYVEATAYCTGSVTSRGTKPKLGTIAVNPSIIPYGTQIYVPNYGYGKALDTGAFRNYDGGTKNQIDIWLNTEKECRKWGRKYKYKIYVKLG